MPGIGSRSASTPEAFAATISRLLTDTPG